jgi:CheY-like chemotaxis protein
MLWGVRPISPAANPNDAPALTPLWIMNKPLAILVAEDNPNDTFFFKRAFSQAGIHGPVIFVRDGQEVIDYLNGEPPFNDRDSNPIPKLIILDLAMPRVNGFDVLEWMRHDAALSHIPVLAFSGIRRPTDINRAYSLGAKLFLVKTADVDQWTAILEQLAEIYGLACAKPPRPALSAPHPEFEFRTDPGLAPVECTSAV